MNYVIIGFDIFKYGKQSRLDINNIVLKIDDKEYLPNKNICYKFNELGNCLIIPTNSSAHFLAIL